MKTTLRQHKLVRPHASRLNRKYRYALVSRLPQLFGLDVADACTKPLGRGQTCYLYVWATGFTTG
ncbi:MAG: hypothetical protein ACO2YK_12580, partial [Paracoccaceae bacterium]